ncbi:MAG: crotonase/enoyl-CoA hydratase family protein [Pseudomonadota bacterium]
MDIQSFSKETSVVIDEKNGILIIKLNKPESRNSLDHSMAADVANAVDYLDKESRLKVAILTGTSEGFSSGMDLKAFLRGETPIIEGRGLAGITETPPEKPIIAAVDGFALAGGCELALACDLIVASTNSVFGLPEVKRGLIAGGGGALNLPKKIPKTLALEMILTGEPITASRAYEIGLVNQVTSGPAVDAAYELAVKIARNAPEAVKVSKQIVIQSQNWDTNEQFEAQQKLIAPIFNSADAREGAKAFAEKREPIWSV